MDELEPERTRLLRTWLAALPAVLADVEQAVTEARQEGDNAAADTWLDRRAEYRRLGKQARRTLGEG